MLKMRGTAVIVGSDECIPQVEITDNDSPVAEIWGERNAKLFLEAEKMFQIIKTFVKDGAFDRLSAAKIIYRIENGVPIKVDGLTMEDYMMKVVKRA